MISEPLNSESSPLERQEPSNQEPSNQANQESSNQANQESSKLPPKQNCYPSRQALRSKTTCQHCDAKLSYHALIYKHKCPQVSVGHEARVNRSLEKLKERAAKLAEQQLVVAN